MTYGIPPKVLPFDDGGETRLKNHSAFIRRRKKAEHEKTSNVSYVLIPSNLDILVGKGKSHEHAGNIRLHLLVDEMLPRFDEVGNKEKTAMVNRMVSELQSQPCRFLSCDEGMWFEVPDSVAREKVSQLFRSRRKLREKALSRLRESSTSEPVQAAKRKLPEA